MGRVARRGLIEGRVGELGFEGRLFLAQILQPSFRRAQGFAQGLGGDPCFGAAAAFLATVEGRSRFAPVGGLCVVLCPPAALGRDKAAVIVEVAVEGPAGSIRDQPQPVDDRLDQVGVVAGENDRAFEIVERLDEGFARVHVQVVGRLVEQKNLRRRRRHQREQESRFLAAGKIGDGEIGGGGAETEAGQVRAHRRLGLVGHGARHAGLGGFVGR